MRGGIGEAERAYINAMVDSDCGGSQKITAPPDKIGPFQCIGLEPWSIPQGHKVWLASNTDHQDAGRPCLI